MAGYSEWYESHAKKHKAIVDKLLKRGFSKAQIIDYFDFDNMVEAEPDFCPLYERGEKCHDMETLNCYLCSCPHFRFNDNGMRSEEGMTVYSECAIDSKEGKPGRFGGAIHQDCSACTIPHRRKFIEKVFDTDWKKIMAECRLK